MNPIRHNDYEKLSDDLLPYILGNNVIIRFNVILGKKLKDDTRYHYHHEYKYNSNKYINQNSLITLRRTFDYYISIENLKNINGNKEFIIIRIQDIIYVREMLRNATLWFRQSNIFAKKNNKLIILGKIEPILIQLPMSKYIMLEPIIIDYDNNIQVSGVRMSLNSNDNFVDINVDNFMGFVYVIDTIDMYQSAQLLINYLQRPQYGENLHTFNTLNDFNENIDGYVETKIPNRKIQSKRQKSIFSKLDEL